jgi:aminopeptidase-like protein
MKTVAMEVGNGAVVSVPQLSPMEVGDAIYTLLAEIFPICRSVAGEGVRETLRRLQREIPLTIHEVPSGTQVFDWTIPCEWTIRDAYIRNEAGERVVDFHACNLHVVNHSAPIRAILPLGELRKHIFTLPEQPDRIPYRKSAYDAAWGFCMAHERLTALPDGLYEAVIDSDLDEGSLSYGEFLHAGASEEEVLLSAHICHPSLANDNCSGLALLTLLAKALSDQKTRYSYRFVFAPGTIGALAWLARNEARTGKIRHGLVVSCVGDGGGPTYKKSRRGNAFIDRVASHVLRHAAPAPVILDFSPYGYDERQYGSPGFNLPVGLFQRSLFGNFPEYHTSADNLDFVQPEHLASSYTMIRAILDVIENNFTPQSTMMKGERQLGRHGLYTGGDGSPTTQAANMAMLWVLNLADGQHTLLDIAERANLPFANLLDVVRRLQEHGLLEV